MLERDERRFYAKVALPNEQGCMLWLAGTDEDGYGLFGLKGRNVRAHRFAYELWVGPIPEGLQVDHVKANGCTNRHCVAPDHLEAVTGRVNVLRGDTIPARNAAKTHCIHGHPFSEDNTYWLPDGRGRACRACHRRRQRSYRSQGGD